MVQYSSARVRPGSVHYELDVGAFTPEGTLPAAAARLDHLSALGVDVVELAAGPVEAESGLASFVDACHARGLAVLLGLSGPVELADLRALFGGYRLDGVRAPGVSTELGVAVARLAAELGRPLALLPAGDTGQQALHGLLTGDLTGLELGAQETLADVLQETLVHAGSVSRGGHRALTGHHFTTARTPCATDRGLLRVGATVLFTGPFTPVVFMGEEWGAPVRRSRDLALAGAGRAPYRGGSGRLDAATLDWAESTRPGPSDLLAFYRQVIGVRRATPDLADPRLDRVGVRCGDQFLAMRRGGCEVVANLAATTRRVNLDGYARRVLLATAPGARIARDAADLPAHSAIVVSYA
jgi:maltooligosyltrehalose trehalohydrolase